jgi:hypothetical protein
VPNAIVATVFETQEELPVAILDDGVIQITLPDGDTIEMSIEDGDLDDDGVLSFEVYLGEVISSNEYPETLTPELKSAISYMWVFKSGRTFDKTKLTLRQAVDHAWERRHSDENWVYLPVMKGNTQNLQPMDAALFLVWVNLEARLTEGQVIVHERLGDVIVKRVRPHGVFGVAFEDNPHIGYVLEPLNESNSLWQLSILGVVE